MDLIADVSLILLAALAGGYFAQRAGQPMIVGYILAGIIVGPFTAGPTVGNVHEVESLAELGVALLLFSLGLELSFRELAPVRNVALFGGALQIALTMGLGFIISRGLGWPWKMGVWFGALIALSSTMVALKTIQSQGRLGTLSSRVMLGLLVVQDLAVVPLMIVLPALSQASGGSIGAVLFASGRAVLLLGVLVVFATRVVPRTLAYIARWNSRELFFLSTTTLAVGVGYLASVFGLSMALGAFVAGLVVNESDYAHQALSDVAPLRDLFGTVFFVSVGMLLDPIGLWQQVGILSMVILAVIVGKGVIVGATVRVFGYRNIVPLASGLTLFQVGEFAFVLARVGLSSGAMSNDVYTMSMNTAIITMVLTPVLSKSAPALYQRFWPQRPSDKHEAVNLPSSGLADHVVIAGGGRVGRAIGDALAGMSLPFVIVELDDRRVRQARLAGYAVIYGDATQPVVLEAAGVAHARAVLITLPAFHDAQSLVTAVKHLRPDLPIVARAEGTDDVGALYGLGIQEVTSPEFEAAIEMTRQALTFFNVSAYEGLRVASAMRHERYQDIHPLDSGLAFMSGIGELARQLDFAWLGVPADSPLADRTLAELSVRATFGTSVAGIIRDGQLLSSLDGQTRLEPGDLVAVLGTREGISQFDAALRSREDPV